MTSEATSIVSIPIRDACVTSTAPFVILRVLKPLTLLPLCKVNLSFWSTKLNSSWPVPDALSKISSEFVDIFKTWIVADADAVNTKPSGRLPL